MSTARPQVDQPSAVPAQRFLAWNRGGWFGSQIGSTLWLLPCGFSLLSEDGRAACLAFAAFVACNLWGLALWRRRARLSAHRGIQAFLLGAMVTIAIVTVGTEVLLGASLLPHWVIAAPLPLMVHFWWLERQANRPAV